MRDSRALARVNGMQKKDHRSDLFSASAMAQTLECRNWFSITSSLYEDTSVRLVKWSDRQDLNLRPLRPERSALARLSYGPIYRIRLMLLNLESADRHGLRP